jgi:hypothetical protein
MEEEIQPDVVEAQEAEETTKPSEEKKEETETEKTETDPILSELEETEDKSKDEVVETTKEESTEDETLSEGEQEKEEKPLTPEEQEKENARIRYEERQKVRDERKARVDQQTQDYINETDDTTEQRLRAIEAQEYSRIIENNENTLIAEFERVKVNPDLQIFNPDSDQYNEKAYDKALRDYNAGYLEYDNGNLIGIKGSLYEHLTETAELLQGAVKSGQIKQVRDGRKMKSNADSKPAAPPKEIEKDPILETLRSD